ncbi:hypothetical protein CWB98_23550, partial [Pseudoalteromonas rubra]
FLGRTRTSTKVQDVFLGDLGSDAHSRCVALFRRHLTYSERPKRKSPDQKAGAFQKFNLVKTKIKLS